MVNQDIFAVNEKILPMQNLGKMEEMQLALRTSLLDGSEALVHPSVCGEWRVRLFLRRKCLRTKTFLTCHRQGKKWRVVRKSPKKVSANYAPTGNFRRRFRKDARFSIVSFYEITR